jgi:hypothetical protein
MKEILRTVGFVGAAVLIVSLAWLSRPASPVTDTQQLRDTRLFPDFNDPLAATSMEIVEFDKDTAQARPFTVEQVDVKGKPRWSIPTHENYPADAKDQVADAAAGMMGLRILEVVGSSPSDHEYYGVVDPDPKKRKSTTGVGTRVTMKDNRGKTLMSLIIGKEVPDRPGLRYVRKVDEDPVYVVKVSTDKLSSKFKDWIEKDLLKLNAWDIKQIQIQDYSVDELQGAIDRRSNMVLEYNDTGDPKWKLIKDDEFQDGRWVSRPLAADEELNTEKLDGVRNALDDLEIVDVNRKPPGLSGNLKAAEDFKNNEEAVVSLARRGFYVAQVGDEVGLFSNEGEIRCLMKNGVEYVLRFGEIAGSGSGTSAKKEDKDKGKDKGSGSTGLNRYIFVMAEFNPDIIPKPELKPLPEEPKKPAGKEAAKTETPQPKPAAQPQAGTQAPAEKPADPPAPPKAGGQSAPSNAGGAPPAEKPDNKPTPEKAGGTRAGKPPMAPGGQSKPDSATEKAAEKKGAKAPTETTEPEKKVAKAASETPERKDAKAPGEPAKAKDAKAGDKSDIESKREEIQKENKRKQDEYDAKVEEGKKKVKELNDRFADWYYVISDEVYQKIHLGRDQIVKKKEKKAEKKAGEQDAGEAKTKAAGTAPESKKPEEPIGPVGEFQKLKHEGPDGNK